MRLLTSYFDSPLVSGGKLRDTAFVRVAGCSPDWIELKRQKLAPKRAWLDDRRSRFKDRPNSDKSKALYAAKYREIVLGNYGRFLRWTEDPAASSAGIL